MSSACPEVRNLRPMLATLADPPLEDPQLVYEPKYDGIRALVEIVPSGPTSTVRIFSRLGNEKSAQFPEITKALSQFGIKLPSSVIVDGEIVALDERGHPAGFQRLQGRIHLTSISEIAAASQPVAFVAFDLLCEDGRSLCELPLIERRARLERLFERWGLVLLHPAGRDLPTPFCCSASARWRPAAASPCSRSR